MVKLRSYLPWLLAFLAFAGSAFQTYDARYAQAESARLQTTLDSLAKQGARVESVYVTRRDTVVRRITRVDSLTQTVTEWKHDTLRVVEYVTATDSALRACSALILSCDERHRVSLAQLAATERKAQADLAVLKARIPTLRARLVNGAMWAGAGALAVTVLRP